MLELNKLYNMDCMEGMKQIPDKYFDLAIVDPPYGIKVARRGTIGGDCRASVTQHTPVKWDLCPPTGIFYRITPNIRKPNNMGCKSFYIAYTVR